VAGITSSVVLGEQNKTYGPNGSVDRLRQREWGVFIQDSWKLNPRLTVNYGFRLENQYPFRSFSNTYTRPGYAGLFGVSGTGNLFQPGATGGTVPTLTPVTADTAGYDPTHFPSPTVGVAYVLPQMNARRVCHRQRARTAHHQRRLGQQPRTHHQHQRRPNH
jgi:hypothetical protein